MKLVEQILASAKYATKVLDPFSGTGTTALCAAYAGIRATGLEINPFLVWFSSVKCQQFSPVTVEKARSIGAMIAASASSANCPLVDPPPIHNISRWWNEKELQFLCRLKACIQETVDTNCGERDLLLVAFCRTIIKLSNAAFNHQSMSFKRVDESPYLFELQEDFGELFRRELGVILDSAMDNPRLLAQIIPGDAREPSGFLKDEYDLLITSPPYPNRISYIRELRPYMYWLDYLTNGRDAGEFDWQAIGGTWGVATSRLAKWKESGKAFVPSLLKRAIGEIASPKNSNGELLANYIAKYFQDIWYHLENVFSILTSDAEVHYIVGNSKFYGTLLPAEQIYKDMLLEAGFRDVGIVRIRKRNSKAGLFEFDVIGRKRKSIKQTILKESSKRSSHRRT
jgi:hypothetical protein